MNHTDALRTLFEKNRLAKPLPPEVRKELFAYKKAALFEILGKNRESRFFTKIILSLFLSVKNLGISFSVARSALAVSAAAAACAVFLIAAITATLTDVLIKKPVEDRAFAVFTAGETNVIHTGREQAALAVGDVVFAQDTVRTGGSSSAVLQIGSRAIVKISEKTDFIMPPLLGGKEAEFFLNYGKVLLNVEKLSKDSHFSVKTITSTAAIRGTLFSVSNDGVRTVVAVSSGAVLVRVKDKAGEQMVESGTAAEITQEIRVRPITKEEMTELTKISDIPITRGIGSLDKPEREKLSDEIKRKMEEIDKETGSGVPKTLEEIRAKYGKIDVLHLFNGRVIRGAVLSRGAAYTVLTPAGTLVIPNDQVENTEIIR